MSFKTNDVEQLSLFDSFTNLTAREQKALENSWAKVFAEEVFPKIDEKPFAVLYSEKASRPNTPVNVIIGYMGTFLLPRSSPIVMRSAHCH